MHSLFTPTRNRQSCPRSTSQSRQLGCVRWKSCSLFPQKRQRHQFQSFRPYRHQRRSRSRLHRWYLPLPDHQLVGGRGHQSRDSCPRLELWSGPEDKKCWCVILISRKTSPIWHDKYHTIINSGEIMSVILVQNSKRTFPKGPPILNMRQSSAHKLI